jgi:hypothetical protein
MNGVNNISNPTSANGAQGASSACTRIPESAVYAQKWGSIHALPIWTVTVGLD